MSRKHPAELLTDGPWVGWEPSSGRDPFEEMVGPFYSRRDSERGWITGCMAALKNTNDSGVVHGGCLMTVADHALFTIARDFIGGGSSVTVSLQGEFLSPARMGTRLIGSGEVMKAGKSLLFVRGVVTADEEKVLSFSGVVKVFLARS